ncbi:MAG: DUF5979 domain-containing protein [Bacillota bacterium]|nr:DUF5979 domain-containing protein [Bacillota bacterium]
MKSRQFKKAMSFAFSLLLTAVIIFSISVSYVFAEETTFTGTESLQVEENGTVDLLQGVSAVSPAGEILNVTVKDISCETDENYQYDGSGRLNVGTAGAVYHIEYEAFSSSNTEDVYSTIREITVIPEEALLEEGLETSTEEMPDPSVIEGTPIIYENGIHYIIDPQYPDKKITLFCMNNELNWPHHTENMGDIQVPNYTEGYLTPDDFDSQEAYDDCMRRLSKLLYAGYPYNGEYLYKIVQDSSDYAPTEDEFNKMLIVPPVLQTAYPYLGHHNFTYNDWKSQNQEHLKELQMFVEEVAQLNISNGTTSNGLTYADIASMPFYKASFSIINCNNDTPLSAFQYLYGASYFVTEEEAYNATQEAVWHLLWEYGIPDNTLEAMSLPLSHVLYIYSERGGLLDYQPSISDIQVAGDLHFTYNEKDGLYHSGPLRIIEPEEYRGLYRLHLPKGVTALCDNLNYVYGNEEYELVSNHKPSLNEVFEIEAEFVWLEQFKQYSPTPDIEIDGKKFQHMIGAVIHNETLNLRKQMEASQEGTVAITKQVVGEANSQKEFEFTLSLPSHKDFNGLHGDLEFHNGVAKFTLKDGETKKAEHLPSGAYYVVEEKNIPGYQTGITNQNGEIPIEEEILVTFINTKLPDLSLSKTITGEGSDKEKQFEFIIQLKDNSGLPVTNTFNFEGSAIENSGAEKPADGTVHFTNGEAKISLSHGQMITIRDLPYESTYTITETENKQDPYTATYDGKPNPATGILNADLSISVVNHKESVPSTETDTPDNIPENQGGGKDSPSPQPSESGSTETTGNLVKTGDTTLVGGYIITIAGALSLMIALAIAKRIRNQKQ